MIGVMDGQIYKSCFTAVCSAAWYGDDGCGLASSCFPAMCSSAHIRDMSVSPDFTITAPDRGGTIQPVLLNLLGSIL